MFDLPPLPAAPQSVPVTFVGAGPGAAAHLTLGAFRALQGADVVICDHLVGDEVLALIPARAHRIYMGKVGFGPHTSQTDINAALVAQARTGAQVVRLKGGDTGIFGRLDEEISALEAAGIAYTIIPGLTAASAAAAAIGQSLTQRGRNTSVRIITGHDMAGYAEQDWRSLAQAGSVAAIYMGKKSARFVQGRLLMHGADADRPVTLVENASRADQRILAASLASLPAAAASLAGPAVILLGLAPRSAAHIIPQLHEAQA
jgi:uroporphyrin-III C-methyltransferase